MAVPSFATDLASVSASTTQGTIMRQDSTTALTTTGCLGTITWSEPTGATVGANPTFEPDYFILGVSTVAKTSGIGLVGLGCTTTNAASLPTDGAFFVWGMFTAPNAVSSQSTGGIQVIIGNSSAAYKKYYVAGDDTHLYGGWRCYAVNSTITQSASQGSPTAVNQYFGAIYNADADVARGNPAAVGGIRFGRGYIECTNGSLADGYSTFDKAAIFNSYNDGTNGWNRLGLFQKNTGTFQHQGLFKFGTTATAVQFVDANQTISILSTEFVTSAFNKYEVHNASSIVTLTSCNFLSLTTASKGGFECVADATVTLASCSFASMGTFIFKGNTAVSATTFRNCAQVTYGGGTLLNCNFDTPAPGANVAALMWNNSTDPNSKLDGTKFTAGASGHGIEFGPNAPVSITLKDVVSSGYGADASATAFIHNNSGKALTIYTQGTTNLPTYKNTNNGGTSTTTIVTTTVTLTISGLYTNSDVWVYKASDNTQYLSANPVSTADYIDSAGVQRYKTSWTYSAATYGGIATYIRIYCLGYINQKLSYTLLSADATLPIQQVVDRNYINP